ncbi:ABC transporter ATP-binding protein [Cytophagales bacterium LB-30]|uniref:ABC transporter ATP-binding protein n=1 Tax=Shiella aurantiaca TaxID=3058365 RepID=A0ABT8F165_9BACT|nr:ABC transporter ATP-binding protein [Shiella aurantiaca]MDN4164028.1 ABC transporter ATP-binding protein [Shiella aurantiaca]
MSIQFVLHKVSKTYSSGSKPALGPVSLRIEAGEMISILGQSGAGKSTLLRLLAGLEQLTEGTIDFEGKPLAGPQEKLIAGHEAIALVHQDFKLAHATTVELNIRQMLRGRGIPDKLIQQRTRQALQLCRLERLKERKIETLSGGEKQRLSIARAWVTKPKVLLLDEPFSNLDALHKEALSQTLRDIHQLGTTVLWVTHDAEDALSIPQKVWVMKNGKIVQKGSPQEIYTQPKDAYVAALGGYFSYWYEKIYRPEQFEVLLTPGVDTFEGRVEKSLFMGPYYLLQIKLADEQVLWVQYKNDPTSNLPQDVHLKVPNP